MDTSNLSEDQIKAAKSWSNVGAPGPAPDSMYKPDEEAIAKMHPMDKPRTITVDWRLTDNDYYTILLGHQAREMEDKWNIYVDIDVSDVIVHFHRSWTGFETYRFDIEGTPGNYVVHQFEVEQNTEKYKDEDEESIKHDLLEVLERVIGIKPAQG